VTADKNISADLADIAVADKDKAKKDVKDPVVKRDLAAIGATNVMYSNPRAAVIEGTETAFGVIPAANIAYKFYGVTIGPDPDQTDPSITSDPKFFSFPRSPMDEIANLVFERYYYNRVIPPVKPFRSTISTFPSNLTQAAMQAAINDIAYETTWGGFGGTVPPDQVVVNCYGVVRKGDYLYLASLDEPRITKVRLSDNAVVGATPNFIPLIALNAYVQSLTLTSDGTIMALINEANNPFGTTPATAGYSTSTLIEVVPGVADAAPSWSASNKVSVTQTISGPVETRYDLLNAQKMAYNDGGNIYIAGIGGPQMEGESNVERSTLFRVPVDGTGTLGTPQVVYYGDSDKTYYDIRDIDVSEDCAMLLLGRLESDGMTMTYIHLRQCLADQPDPTVPTQNITGLDNTNAVNIRVLDGESWAGVDFGSVYGGACYTIKYEKSFKHFWCPLSITLPIYDNSSVFDLSTPPVPGETLTPYDYYGSRAAYINSLELFTNNCAYAPPLASRIVRGMHAAVGHGVAASSVSLHKHKDFLTTLRNHREKSKMLRIAQKQKR
jgi:hypothetical protein